MLLCNCVFASCIVCVFVSQCVLLWESAWVALSLQTCICVFVYSIVLLYNSCICVLASLVCLCLSVSCCGRVRGWRCLLSSCTWPSATPLPTHQPASKRSHWSRASTNHKPPVLTVTGIIGRLRHAWSGVAELYTAWGMSRGWRLGGRNCFRVVATPAPNMGGG